MNTSSNTFRFHTEVPLARIPHPAAIAVFTKQFAKELAEYDIRVNAFGPGNDENPHERADAFGTRTIRTSSS